jgi:transposase
MHNYAEVIQESQAELTKLARQHRNSVVGTRLSMLKKLKSREARSLKQAAQQLGYSLRQCQRWFKAYQQVGLPAMLSASQQGRASGERMTEAAWTPLREALVAGEIATYAQARQLLAEHGVSYKDDSSVSKLFKRHKIKAKIGRPSHEKTDARQQAEFKKTLPSA